MPFVGICAGGIGQPISLPRSRQVLSPHCSFGIGNGSILRLKAPDFRSDRSSRPFIAFLHAFDQQSNPLRCPVGSACERGDCD